MVCHPGLTQNDTSDIERGQKSALEIILGKDYTSYENALILMNLKKLTTRREKLCLNFARKTAKTHSHWCNEDTKIMNTRRKVKGFQEVTPRTRIFENPAIPYFTRLLISTGLKILISETP